MEQMREVRRKYFTCWLSKHCYKSFMFLRTVVACFNKTLLRKKIQIRRHIEGTLGFRLRDALV